MLLIMTSNAPDSLYRGLLQNYQQTLNRFVGPTEVFVSGDTLQLKDYSKLDWEWSMFDPEAKRLRHETIFPSPLGHPDRVFTFTDPSTTLGMTQCTIPRQARDDRAV